ncbi:MAG: aminotransferase class V-fold PLP-dependent enzyme [Bdellovibrionales bacterium]|nr:aminotransferase class V-fold PLP-dependent enzyme [Bdellovibrionales bacterium]
MWQKNVRYLDYNASAGISGIVRERLIEYLKNEEAGLANPSSRHRLGQREHHVLFQSAGKISRSFGENVTPDDLIFTSSGTEANQAILHSFVQSGFGLIVGAAEHSASFDVLEIIQRSHPHLWVRTLPLTPAGNHDMARLSDLAREAKDDGIFHLGISLFWANHETGVLTDLGALRETLVSLPLPSTLHLDGAQVWGKIPLDLTASPADLVSFSSHKIGAPAGGGVIWRRKGTPFHPLFPGSQNAGLRGGSENLLGILGMGFACEVLNPIAFQTVTAPLQARLESGLNERLENVRIWGRESTRVSNTSRISFLGFQNYENWVELLDLRGFAISHGSACRANIIEPSRVLLSMGAGREEALNSIRVSFGPASDVSDCDSLLGALVELFQEKIRGRS